MNPSAPLEQRAVIGYVPVTKRMNEPKTVDGLNEELTLQKRGESFNFDTKHLGYEIKVCVLLFLSADIGLKQKLAHGLREKKAGEKAGPLKSKTSSAISED